MMEISNINFWVKYPINHCPSFVDKTEAEGYSKSCLIAMKTDGKSSMILLLIDAINLSQ